MEEEQQEVGAKITLTEHSLNMQLVSQLQHRQNMPCTVPVPRSLRPKPQLLPSPSCHKME
jgi:hypothetical protein